MRFRLLSALLALAAPALVADYKDDIGFTDLLDYLNANSLPVPTGATVSLAMVEASSNGADYLPSVSGITLTDRTGAAGATTSGHATTVASNFFGPNSILSGVTSASADEANTYLTRLLNRAFNGSNPETADVVNHSYVAERDANTPLVLALFDYSINRDGYVAVVGANNGYNTNPDSSAHKPVLTEAYNVISVGVSSGAHDSGTAANGVSYPHLVAPAAYTSYATPMVSAAAALLIETARSNPALSNGDKTVVIKAALIAGATKDAFADWAVGVSSTTPLNSHYGAGQLNVFNSYLIMTGGPQAGAASSAAALAASVAATGWDYSTNTGSFENYYALNVAEGMTADLSIALTWEAVYSLSFLPNGTYLGASLNLADITLTLYEADAQGNLTLLAESAAPDGNVEYLWQTGLCSGDFILKVSSATGAAYGLAWQTDLTAIPEPAAFALLLALATLFLFHTKGTAKAAKHPIR
jgi:hypothetical protein